MTARRRLALAAALMLAAALGAGCARSTPFRCDDDTDCGSGGGRCEGVGFCSIPDLSCTGSLRRFTEAAGRWAGACVEPIEVGLR